MTKLFSRFSPVLFAVGLTATLLAGCVGAGGYDEYGDDGFGTDNYGVYGADFGGWNDGFGVGPYHDDRLLDSGNGFGHHFRGARGDHIPSIAGGGHGNFGGRGGGFGGHAGGGGHGGGFGGGHGGGGGHGR